VKTISIVDYLYTMSISRQNLSIVIVTFKSEAVIHKCIESIDSRIKIIVVENSKDNEFKEILEKKYNNVKCKISNDNLGMGAGNNYGLKSVNTDYALILNPDVILEESTIEEILFAAEKVLSFTIISPLSSEKAYPNYQLDKNIKINPQNDEPFKVKSVDGYAMLLNIKKIQETLNFNHKNFFDENFFMYLENDDLCKRLIDKKENIYIVPRAKINHLGGKAVDEKYNDEIELSRNWHWMWSKFYFNKKHSGFLIAFAKSFSNFFSAVFKFLLYAITNKKLKKRIYYNRAAGLLNAMFNNSSSYRPKIKY
jgi:N-acetylglucosaminyl-diphospho-decaprenol L-rhamnosyltransferase